MEINSRIAAAAMAVCAVFAVSPAEAGEKCVAKAGTASGPTRDFAEYEALLIIKQVTGNWPFESDKIADVKYSCKQDAMWTCVARAKICKK